MNEQELRVGCCADWPKPCGYHEGYLDGYYEAERINATADVDLLVVADEQLIDYPEPGVK